MSANMTTDIRCAHCGHPEELHKDFQLGSRNQFTLHCGYFDSEGGCVCPGFKAPAAPPPPAQAGTVYVGWSSTRGFYRDPDGAYVSRADYDALARRVVNLGGLAE